MTRWTKGTTRGINKAEKKEEAPAVKYGAPVKLHDTRANVKVHKGEDRCGV